MPDKDTDFTCVDCGAELLARGKYMHTYAPTSGDVAGEWRNDLSIEVEVVSRCVAVEYYCPKCSRVNISYTVSQEDAEKQGFRFIEDVVASFAHP